MKQNKYSVVHNGPIFYTDTLHKALTRARKIVREKRFILDDKWTELEPGEAITVCELRSDFVQLFRVE